MIGQGIVKSTSFLARVPFFRGFFDYRNEFERWIEQSGVAAGASYCRGGFGCELVCSGCENMTIRDYIKRRVRWAMGIGIGSWVLLAIVGPLGAGGYRLAQSLLPVFAVVGAIGFGGAFISIMFIRCPKCRASLGQSVAMPTAMRLSGRRINFCPYCGVSLDEQMESPANQS